MHIHISKNIILKQFIFELSFEVNFDKDILAKSEKLTANMF